MKKKYNLFHILGFHKHLNCEEFSEFGFEPDTKLEYDSPWSLFAVKYTRYLCLDCGRKFWMPRGNFEEMKMHEKIVSLLQTYHQEVWK